METDRLKFPIERQLDELDMDFGDIEKELEEGRGYGPFSFLDIVRNGIKIVKQFAELLSNGIDPKLKKEFEPKLAEMNNIIKNAIDRLPNRRGNKNEI